jgi:glucokinase
MATGLAIPALMGKELRILNKGRQTKNQNLALMAPGTGLGQAWLIFKGGRYDAVPSEGGHADYSPGEKEELALWAYLNNRFGHVSVERVLSGPGLVNIYQWLKASGRYKEPNWLRKRMEEKDPAKAVTDAALSRRQPLCNAALSRFVRIFGAVSGNLALTGMATGGVYLGGGIPPKILPTLEEGLFMAAFVDKGRFKQMLENIPVKVILNDRAAMLGAAQYAFQMMEAS